MLNSFRYPASEDGCRRFGEAIAGIAKRGRPQLPRKLCGTGLFRRPFRIKRHRSSFCLRETRPAGEAPFNSAQAGLSLALVVWAAGGLCLSFRVLRGWLRVRAAARSFRYHNSGTLVDLLEECASGRARPSPASSCRVGPRLHTDCRRAVSTGDRAAFRPVDDARAGRTAGRLGA